jgi:hypothetical protein
MISVAATNMRTMDLDTCVIDSYDAGSGLVTCEEKLMGFHFGSETSTYDDYWVDMRAEVSYLERNIEINASIDDIGYILQEPWGCRILVSDYYDLTTGEIVNRIGNLYLDNVAVYNCS